MKRSQKVWGKESYQFDFDAEIRKYKALYRKEGKFCRIFGCKEKEAPSFQHYHEWKASIVEKYAEYPAEKLMDFSKYLSYQRRILKSDIEFLWCWLVVFITLFAETWLIKVINITEENDAFYTTIPALIIVCIAIAVFSFFLKTKLESHDLRQHFYRDYMEIIDELKCKKDSAK